MDGLNDVPNVQHGLLINEGASKNKIGGSSASERNIISGNGNDMFSHGIVISDVGTSENIVSGNYIGLNAEGTEALGNRGDGIQIVNETTGNIVGGTTWQEKNVISGNNVTGMAIYGGSFENKVIGNYIGLDATGTKNIGHPGTGIYFGGAAHDNLIGGSRPGLCKLHCRKYRLGWSGFGRLGYK